MDFIKDLIEKIKSKPLRALFLVIVILIISFTAYTPAREGFVTMFNDIFPKKGVEITNPGEVVSDDVVSEEIVPKEPVEAPELYDVTYDKKSNTVQGSVRGVSDPDDYRIILFILTDQWYVKPDFDRYAKKGMVELSNKYSFLVDAYTVESRKYDIKATKYAVFLVPASYGGLKHMNDYDGAKEACVFSYMDVI